MSEQGLYPATRSKQRTVLLSRMFGLKTWGIRQKCMGRGDVGVTSEITAGRSKDVATTQCGPPGEQKLWLWDPL